MNIYRKTALAGSTFAWTDRIAPHPATKGVTGLCYSLDRWEPGEPGVLPVKTDANWQVLIKGMPSRRHVPADASRDGHESQRRAGHVPPVAAAAGRAQLRQGPHRRVAHPHARSRCWTAIR